MALTCYNIQVPRYIEESSFLEILRKTLEIGNGKTTACPCGKPT